MKRWDNDVNFGTEILKITWEKIERSLTDVEDEKHFVPFKAEGPRVRECIMACTIVKRDMLNMRMTNTLL